MESLPGHAGFKVTIDPTKLDVTMGYCTYIYIYVCIYYIISNLYPIYTQFYAPDSNYKQRFWMYYPMTRVSQHWVGGMVHKMAVLVSRVSRLEMPYSVVDIWED